jgi:hypothetical protein|tara:strand:+ start:280 stop:474 length:195 start_codon:yes stop_codon:yes gene_type:complete
MCSVYHISDVEYIIWKMPLVLVFRMIINHQIASSGGKKQYNNKEADQISDLIDGFEELRNNAKD